MADVLRAKDQKLLEAKQQEWASKKWMWLVDAREGCIAVHIIKEAGDDVTVKLPDGNVRAAGRSPAATAVAPC